MRKSLSKRLVPQFLLTRRLREEGGDEGWGGGKREDEGRGEGGMRWRGEGGHTH